MDSMRQVMAVKLDKIGAATTSFRDQEKCHLTSEIPASSPASKEAVETVQNIDDDGDNSTYAESVASECSIESDASSNAVNGGDSQVSDSDSLSPYCEEEKLKRCLSGGSIVTYEASSKLREEGECERTGDRKLVRQSKGSQSNAADDEQERSINAVQRMAESIGPAWTDDKHCSYLNSMEQTFVQSLYGQDYRTVDVSGQDDHDCVESRPMYGTAPDGTELFTSLQRGCYDQREYYKPQFLHHFAPSTSAVFRSPWIQHFNPKTATQSSGGTGQDADIGHPSTGFAEGDGSGKFVNEGVKEEVMESSPDIPPITQCSPAWNGRHQSQHYASTSGPLRVEAGIQSKKRPCNLDPCNDVIYRPKKLKPTQRWLAEIDLEMEEQFVLKQEHLKKLAANSDLKDVSQPVDNGIGRFDLNQELEQEEEMNSEDTLQPLPQAFTKPTNIITSTKEPLEIRTTRVQADTLTKTDQSKSHQRENVVVKSEEGILGDERTDIKKVVGAAGRNDPLAMTQKLSKYESIDICQVELGFDEEEELEFLRRRSPRASKTYTWGSIGPRRRLHNECNVMVEGVALGGGVKDSRDQELRGKGNFDQI